MLMPNIDKYKFLRVNKLYFIYFTLLILIILLKLFNPLKIVSDYSKSKAIFDDENTLINITLSQDQKYRLPIFLDQVSQDFIKATLIFEDKYFYYHLGVNPYSLVRALIATSINSEKPIGASTITMQFVRLHHHLNTRTILGKLKQIIYSVCYELFYSKRSILEAYLTIAPYGANIEGIEAASLIYFNKRAKDLTLDESVTLAVIPQDPSLRLRNKGKIKLDTARTELLRRLKTALVPKDVVRYPKDIPNYAKHFTERIIERDLNNSYLYSNLNLSLQTRLESLISNSIRQYADLGIKNASAMIVKGEKLEVKAYVGSGSYGNKQIEGFVNGLNAERSPGSLLKPFVYGLALDQGLIISETLLIDVPLRMSTYHPENFERNFLGPLSATDALVKSRNVPAIELLNRLKPIDSLYNLIKEAGVKRLKTADYYGLALILGGMGITAEEVSMLYGSLLNSGYASDLSFLKNEIVSKKRILTSEATFLLNDMLSKNPPALSQFRNRKIPWKTGTSFGSRDAWSSGIFGSYVIVVWVGNFNNEPNPNFVGRDIAGPIFFSVVDMLDDHMNSTLSADHNLNIKKVEVCALSGAMPNENCPHKKQSWFIPGVSPIKKCFIHKKVFLDEKTGLRACDGNTTQTSKVYEIWDSQTLKLYSDSGLSRNTPPAYLPECRMKTEINSQSIKILSPESKIEYYIEKHRPLEIEFMSSPQSDAKTITWFVDDVVVSQVPPQKSFYWKAKSGTFIVRAVDDLGRIGVVTLKVKSAL